MPSYHHGDKNVKNKGFQHSWSALRKVLYLACHVRYFFAHFKHSSSFLLPNLHLLLLLHLWAGDAILKVKDWGKIALLLMPLTKSGPRRRRRRDLQNLVRLPFTWEPRPTPMATDKATWPEPTNFSNRNRDVFYVSTSMMFVPHRQSGWIPFFSRLPYCTVHVHWQNWILQ